MLCSKATSERMLALIVCGIILGISLNVINVGAPTTPRMYVDTYPHSGSGTIINENLQAGKIPTSGISQINSYPSSYTEGYGNLTIKPTSNTLNGTWTNPGNAYDLLPTTYAENSIAGPFKKFKSYASSSATNGTVTDPANAYDKNQASFATYDMSGNPAPPSATRFEVLTFNTSIVYTRPRIDLIVRWNATVGEINQTTNWSEFRILYYVGTIPNILVPWVSMNVAVHTDEFQGLLEPNDGIWSNADISSLKLRIESRKVQAGGTAQQYGSFRVFEVWVSGGEMGFSYLNMTGFTTSGTITSVGFKIRIWHQSYGCSYRILFYVGSAYTVMRDWTTTNETTTGGAVVTFDNQPEPNDGSWSATDITNLILRVETKKERVDGSGAFRVYDAFAYLVMGPPTPAGLLTNPGNAYDKSMSTYAQIDISKNVAAAGGWSYFDPKSFNTSIVNDYFLTGIDINMNFTADPLTNSYYRTMLRVGSKSAILGDDWTAVPRTDKTILTFAGIQEPNDGVWNWTDIDNLRIGFETKKAISAGSGYLRIYEVWITLPINRIVIGVSVENAYDLWSYSFFLNWTGNMFDGMTAIEGPFLKSMGPTFFTFRNYNDATGNYTKVTCTLQLPARRGPDGNGTLAYIELLVQGYGSTKLHLYSTGMQDSFLDPTDHTTTDGYFRNGLTGDANLDKTVNVFDILAVKSRWGRTPASPDWIREYDVNNDGAINVFDILTVKANWGRTTP